MKAGRGESHAPDRQAASGEVRQRKCRRRGPALLERSLAGDFLTEAELTALRVSGLDLAPLFQNRKAALLN